MVSSGVVAGASLSGAGEGAGEVAGGGGAAGCAIAGADTTEKKMKAHEGRMISVTEYHVK